MSYVFPYGSNLCNNIQSWQERKAKLHSWAAAIIHLAAIFTFTELKSCPFWHP